MNKAPRTPSTSPDGYPLAPGDPYAPGHRLLDAYLAGALAKPAAQPSWARAAARDILDAGPETQIMALHAALERLLWSAGPGAKVFAGSRLVIRKERWARPISVHDFCA